MAFRASNVLPEFGYRNARNQALSLKNYLQAKSDLIGTTGTDANDLLTILATMKQASADFNEIKLIGGIAAYAIEQEDDPLYDVVAEFNALITLIDTAVSNLAAAFPRDASGYLLILQMTVSDEEWRGFTPAQLASIKSDIDAIIAQVV